MSVKGNTYYLLRTKHGRDSIYNTPEELWAACVEYFEEVEANPFYRAEKDTNARVIKEDGSETVTGSGIINIPTIRPFTLQGLQLWIGIARNTWKNYKDRQGFLPVIEQAEDIIYNQKFEGAAVGAFNANIISRDLGLADKKEIKANVFGSDTPLIFE